MRSASGDAIALNEPYRTLLGHFRHEIGHYYWDRLIEGQRSARGISRAVRRRASGLRRRSRGATTTSSRRQDWQARFVSAYATMHPWEDWAETWAHYLHITDTVETAAACGIALRPQRADELVVTQLPAERGVARRAIRSAHRQLVSAHLRAQQPQSCTRLAGRLPLRAVPAGHREAAVRARHRRGGRDV